MNAVAGDLAPLRPLPPTRPVRCFPPLAGIANVLRTAALLAALGGPAVAVGSLFGPTGTRAGLALGGVIAAALWLGSGRLALAAAGARPADPWHYPLYHEIVRRLCIRAWMPAPRLYVTPDRRPNAFATGRGPDHAAIVVTEGLLELLDPGELEAVLAHELAHIGHRDVLFTSVVTGVATAARAVTPLGAVLRRLARSPRRERHADDAGARLLDTGLPLARALAKIERAARAVPPDTAPVPAATCIVDPSGDHRDGATRGPATHPSTSGRVARLTGGTWRSHR